MDSEVGRRREDGTKTRAGRLVVSDRALEQHSGKTEPVVVDGSTLVRAYSKPLRAASRPHILKSTLGWVRSGGRA